MKIHLMTFVFAFSLFMGKSFGAFDVSPIILTASPTGSGATVTTQLSNNGDTKTPVQLTIVYREPDLTGTENYEKAKDASELFQVIPAQIILAPKEKRTVRITYIGDKNLKSEQAFRFIAEEFPIDVSDPTRVKNKTVANISILSKYVGSLYVRPAGVASKLTFETEVDKSSSTPKMIVTIKNVGTSHQMLQDNKYGFQTSADKKIISMSAETVKALGNQNILAGITRKITIPWPAEVPVGPVQIVPEAPAAEKK